MAKTTATDLLQAYKDKKAAPKPNPVIAVIKQLFPLLKEIAERKEVPIEITNEVTPSDVKVDAPIINFPEIVFPEQKEINLTTADYSKLLIELKVSVDSLKVAVENRPKRWKVKRIKGFIDEVVGVDEVVGEE